MIELNVVEPELPAAREWKPKPPFRVEPLPPPSLPWRDRTKVCVDNPGRWCALVATGTQGEASSIALRLRRGIYKGLEPGDWEVATRGCIVYARYLGAT